LKGREKEEEKQFLTGLQKVQQIHHKEATPKIPHYFHTKWRGRGRLRKRCLTFSCLSCRSTNSSLDSLSAATLSREALAIFLTATSFPSWVFSAVLLLLLLEVK